MAVLLSLAGLLAAFLPRAALFIGAGALGAFFRQLRSPTPELKEYTVAGEKYLWSDAEANEVASYVQAFAHADARERGDDLPWPEVPTEVTVERFNELRALGKERLES